MKTKFQKLKEAVTNPPPERLMAIEYKSHILQALGILVVCVMLIIEGFWYIIFALIFGVGISYSQGVTAYQKYKFVKSMSPPEKPKDFVKDVSPTRKRGKIIDYALGWKAKWSSMFMAVFTPILILNLWLGLPYGTRWEKVTYLISYPIIIIVTYIILYYVFFYMIARPIYSEKIKEDVE